MSKTILALGLLLASVAFGADRNCFTDGRCASMQNAHVTAKHVWYASIAAAFAGQTLDCVSSVGFGYESNAILRGANGQFSPAKGIPLKLGIVGAITGAQYLAVRHGSDHYRMFTAVNAILAGEGMFAAAHNFKLRSEVK